VVVVIVRPELEQVAAHTVTALGAELGAAIAAAEPAVVVESHCSSLRAVAAVEVLVKP
jgi:hypothetical protein